MKMRRSRCTELLAFTLPEVLICCMIITLMAMLGLPALASAKLAAAKTQTKSNLHQLHLMFALYREDEAGSDVGDLYGLGLPPLDSMFQKIQDLGLVPPRAKSRPDWGSYYILIPDPDHASADVKSVWTGYNARCASQSVFIADLTWGDADPDGAQPYKTKAAVGVSLAGSIVDRKKKGFPFMSTWWGCPQGE